MQHVSMHALVEILGREATDAFLNEFGGLYIHIPMRNTNERSRHFESILGTDAFNRLRRAYGGENISLPTPERETLKEKIIPLLESGWSYNAIAKELGCHWRHVAGVKQDIAKQKKLKKKKLYDMLLPIRVEENLS